jgi:hypothetical protein
MTKRTEHRWAVDGIEEEVARIEEDGARMLSIPRHLLPPGVTEGQLLNVTRVPGSVIGAVVITITIDESGTAAALARSKATTAQAMAASKKHDPGGNVSF